MSVISVEHLSKAYHLGQIGTGTFSRDLEVWWAKIRGKPNPLLRIGEKDHGNRDGEELWALKDVSFTVEQGEVLGIIGRNGAGKSTLLKILSRVTAPTSGKIKVKGRIASLLEVGTGFHPELTGRENIYLNGAILGMKRDEITRKFDEIVDFAEVEKFIDTPVKRYSSGMYVRLAFAVAAHLDPEILVVDEVLAVGDAEFQKKCLGKMGDVAKEGRTVLFVSHNMAAVENLCKRGIVIFQGQVLFDGLQTDSIQYYMRKLDDASKEYALLERRDRVGNGLIRFTKVEFRDAKGHQIDIVASGDDVDVCLFFETDHKLTSENIHVGLTFYTALGVPVFSQSTRLMKVEFARLPVKGVFICKLRRLPLSPSIYYISINVKVDEEYADYINNATSINVIEGDYYGTGKIYPAFLGVCLVDGQWLLES